MPPAPVSYRPQTLKQAKKAYRKSGATVRLSASELAVIERRAVLQERADRIKEREARRKANIKRKEERNQREREARQRMGLAEPAKEGIHVGPSQLSLGRFMDAGQKRKREEEYTENTEVSKEGVAGTELKGCQTSSLPRTPWRNPLKLISPNSSTPKTLPLGASRTEWTKAVGPEVSEMAPPPLPSIPKALSQKPSIQQKPQATSKASEILNEEDGGEFKPQRALMRPPPLRKPIESQSIETIQQQKPCNVPPQYRPPDAVEDCWGDFFASSTQIARELSPPSINSIPTIPLFPQQTPPPQPPATIVITPKDDAASLLDHLSTQDLEFSEELTQPEPHVVIADDAENLLAQISTQDLDFSGDLTQVPPPFPAESSDFDEDLTEEDLEDVAQEFERDSTAKSKSRSLTPQKPKGELKKSMGKSPFAYKSRVSQASKDSNSSKPRPKFSDEDSDDDDDPDTDYGFDLAGTSLSGALGDFIANHPNYEDDDPDDECGDPPNYDSDSDIKRYLSEDECDEPKLEIEDGSEFDFSTQDMLEF